jgi:hypothetical protein
MLGADVIRAKEGQKWGSSRCRLDSGAPICFLTFHNAEHGSDCHSGFAGGLDRIDCGCACRAHVVDDHDGGPLAAEAFDATTCPVSLLCFANEESMQ